MTEQGPDVERDEGEYAAGGRRKKGRNVPGCLAVLAAVLVLVGGLGFAGLKGVSYLQDRLADPGDYPGPGHGKVLFEVHKGDSAAAIGRALKAEGVVASVQAFTDAAAADPLSRGIQVGVYQLQKEMAAKDALGVLVNPDNLIRNTVTIPEGLRVDQTIDVLAAKTDFSREQFQKVLDEPESLGLPDYANGNPEGYLFPATYDVSPEDTPKTILKAMVDRWRQAAKDVHLEAGAAELGYSPAEVMTVASLVQSEARDTYMPQVARVLYNRLETDGAPTYGLLQLDSTVNFATGKDRSARTTDADRQVDSPYNTYVHQGLPPGPIESPGEAAMKAAAHPADGPWLFYVTVNLRTGETKFATTLAEHNRNVAELDEYCRTQSKRC